jgi:putative DNA primase/helicase
MVAMPENPISYGPAMERMLQAFPQSCEQSNGWWSHPDNPTFDFRENEDGSISIHSWTGRSRDEILRVGGLQVSDTYPRDYKKVKVRDRIDVVDLSHAKLIPHKFLFNLGLLSYRYKGYNCVMIPYYNADGTQHTKMRVRKAITGDYKQCWDEGTPGEIIPYGLHKLDMARDAGYLLIGEGESDAWTCWFHDIPYLGIPGASMQKCLKHLDINMLPPKIYILHEPDQVIRLLSNGDSFYKSTHNALRTNGYQGEILYIDFKKATKHKDPSELHISLWKEKQANQFKDYIAQAIEMAIPANDQPSTYNLTDLGNAERFSAKYRDKVRWCQTWNTWMIFNGKAWEADRTGYVDYLAKVVVRNIYNEAGAEIDDGRRKQLAKHAAASESSRAVRAMLDRAKSELPSIPDEFNKHLYLLNCNNGTLDLRTGELKPHSPYDMLTRCLKIDYNPQAICKKWEEFIQGIFANDSDLIQFMKEALGMSLCGDTSEQCLFICHGSGSNGKTTMLETVRIIMEDYGLAANIETFQVRKNQGIGNDVAELYGARLVTASENTMGSRLNEAFIKKATGKEPLRARRLHENEFQFMPEFTIWFAVNHKPVVKDTSKGMWRRVHFIPFSVTIEGDKLDKHLGEKLLEEDEGILAWLVQGCMAWYKRGHLEAPETVLEATKAYRSEMDTIAGFLEDQCDMSGEVGATKLYQAYKTWCDENGERYEKQTGFGLQLVERGFEKEKTRTGIIYRGLSLIPDNPDVSVNSVNSCEQFSNNSHASKNTSQKNQNNPSHYSHYSQPSEELKFDEESIPSQSSLTPPNRACLHCNTQNWQWDELFERYTCGSCNHG